MLRSSRSALLVFVVASIAAVAVADLASAQEGGRRGRGRGFGRFFLYPKVTILQLEEVQDDLKLTGDQIEQLAALDDELNDGRRQVFEDAGDDREGMREAMAELTTKINDKLGKALDEPQQTRIQEIYLQVNGTDALQDEAVAAALKLTDEQKEQLGDARSAYLEEFMNSGIRDLEGDERTKKTEELIKSRDEKALAVLNDDQRAAFEKMKGAEIKIDRSQLPGFGRGRGQGRRNTT